MSDYTKGTRVTLDIVLAKEYEYTNYTFSYCGTPKYIYTFKNAEGNTFVWKTGVVIGYDEKSENGTVEFIPVYRGDRIQVVASVKELSEYKGEPQVVLTRVKVKKVLERALTKSEKEQIKREKQLASLKDGDRLWEKMPYRQYKEHYADCETLAGSYEVDQHRGAIITVILRKGRLKHSGTRGKRFHRYKVTHEDDKYSTYRAISYENALKQAKKAFPNENFTLKQVCKF